MGILDFLGINGGTGSVDPNAPAAPSFNDRLMSPLAQAGLQLMANHGTPASQGAFAGVPEALTRAAVARKAQDKENKTLAYLREQFPDLARQVDAGLDVGDAFKMSLQQKQFDREMALKQAQIGAPTDDMREFYEAQRNPAFAEYQSRNSTNGRLSTAPVYGTDANGNTVLGQLSNDGRFVPSTLPDGVTPLSPGDLNRDKARGTAVGKAAGESIAGLGSARATADQVRAQVDSIKSDKALPNVLGSVDSRTPIFFEDSARVQAKIDQLQGGAFLQARELLRGGGQITDYEGRKAEAAMIRMNQAQSPEDFSAALDEFNEAVQSGVRRLEEAYGGAFPGSERVAPGVGNGSSGGVGWRVK